MLDLGDAGQLKTRFESFTKDSLRLAVFGTVLFSLALLATGIVAIYFRTKY